MGAKIFIKTQENVFWKNGFLFLKVSIITIGHQYRASVSAWLKLQNQVVKSDINDVRHRQKERVIVRHISCILLIHQRSRAALNLTTIYINHNTITTETNPNKGRSVRSTKGKWYNLATIGFSVTLRNITSYWEVARCASVHVCVWVRERWCTEVQLFHRSSIIFVQW